MTENIKTEPCKTCGGGGFDGNGTGYNNVCDDCAGQGELPAQLQIIEPVTELKIISNTHKFIWNFADVKKTIEINIKKYVGLVVTDENLKDMEAAQKEIASIRTKVDDFRKAVKKEMEKPYKVFEGEIKELLQLIEKAETPLKKQTLQYEQERILAKEVELNKFAQATALNLGIRNNYFNFAVQSSWTNRTAKDPAVRKEIVGLIEAMLDAQRRDDELAEMEKQRVGLIEGQCIAHSALLKTPVVPDDVNHLLVGAMLSDIPGIILAECQKRAEMERKAAESIEVVVEHVNGFHEIPGDDPYPEWGGTEIYCPAMPLPIIPPLPPTPPTPRELATFIETRGSATLPPMPSRNYPPEPSMAPQIFKCVIEYPNITASEGAAIKEFLSARGITYTIISQEPVRSEF